MGDNSVYVLNMAFHSQADRDYWRVHVFSELKKGRARFGFPTCYTSDLARLQEKVKLVKWARLNETERECWSHSAFLLDVKPGDYLLYPALPEAEKFSLASVEGTYEYTGVWDPDGKGDYRHAVPCHFIAVFNSNDSVLNARIAARFKSQGLWHRLPLEGELRELVSDAVTTARRRSAVASEPMESSGLDREEGPAQEGEKRLKLDRRSLLQAKRAGYLVALRDIVRAAQGDEDTRRSIIDCLRKLKLPAAWGHVLEEKRGAKAGSVMETLVSLTAGSLDQMEAEPAIATQEPSPREPTKTSFPSPSLAPAQLFESPKPIAVERLAPGQGTTRAAVLLNAMGALIDKGSEEDADEIALLNMFDETEAAVNREADVDHDAEGVPTNALATLEKIMSDDDEDESDEIAVLDMISGTFPVRGANDASADHVTPAKEPASKRFTDTTLGREARSRVLEDPLQRAGTVAVSSGIARLTAEMLSSGSFTPATKRGITEPFDPDRAHSAGRDNLLVQLPVFDAERPGTVGFLKDITPLGLQVTDFPVEPGQSRSLLIKADHVTDVNPFLVHAECRWTRPDENNRLTSGFRIVAIDEDSLDHLKRLVGFLSQSH
jgi:hypothetical protein